MTYFKTSAPVTSWRVGSIPMHFRQFWGGFWGIIHQVSLSPPSKAGWHKAKDLNHPDTVTPLYLLPHFPELNPIEKLWQWLRKEVTHNAIFHKLEDTVDTSEKKSGTLLRTDLLNFVTVHFMTLQGGNDIRLLIKPCLFSRDN